MNAAIIGLAFVAIILLIVTYLTWRSRKDGELAARERQEKADLDAQKKAGAVIAENRTVDDTAGRLRDGNF